LSLIHFKLKNIDIDLITGKKQILTVHYFGLLRELVL